MKKIIILLFCVTPIFADASEKIQSIPEFLGGLNVANIIKCEKYLKKVCSEEKKPAVNHIYKKELCITKKLPKQKHCTQAIKIREHTAYLPTNIKKYGEVTVFNVTTLADGQVMFYMVDIQGKLIPLTTNLDLTKNKTYHSIRKKYPNIALTNFLYWTKMNENLFPQTHTLSNKRQVLVFKQDLRNGYCVACETVGIAFVAYEFDAQGKYLKSRLLKVENAS